MTAHIYCQDEMVVLDLMARHQELTVRQIKTKTGFSGNRLDECLRLLKAKDDIVSNLEPVKGITYWSRNRTDRQETPAPAVTQEMTVEADQSEDNLEMASDIAELETVTTPNVVNHDAECRDKPRKPRKPYTPNRIAGAYSYRGAMVIKLDRRANAKSVTLSPQDMAMLVAIHGNMT